MQAQARPQAQTTVEDYLALEAQAEERHEYWNGEIIPMTGGTTDHNLLSLSFAAALRSAIHRAGYRVFMADVKVFMPAVNVYTYPDVFAIEREPIYKGKSKVIVLNPCLIVEVLSPSTRSYDRDQKFKAYRTISEFREYVLIDPFNYYVEHYVKQAEDRWSLRLYEGIESTLELETIDFCLPLADLYEEVDFEEEAEETDMNSIDQE